MDNEQNNGVNVEDNNGVMSATVDRDAADAAKAAAEATKESEGLLAGKFKTPADLEKAYKELQKKLGQPRDDAGKTEDTAANDDDDEGKEPKDDQTDDKKDGEGDEDLEAIYGKAVAGALVEAGVDVKAVQAEFEKDGKFSDATFDAFEKVGYPRAVVEAYQRGLTSQAEAAAQEVQSKAEADIAAVKAAVGGDEGVKQLQEYISRNYSVADKQAYNEAVGSGDVAKAIAALQDAKARYDAEFGTEGNTVAGKGAKGVLGYANDAEMMADMRKPAYKKDPAFRAQVEARVAASTYHITR